MCMYICVYICMNMYVFMNVCMCHKEVVFQTVKSNVHAQDTSLQTDKTSNEAVFYILFGKSDLQKMTIQFTP